MNDDFLATRTPVAGLPRQKTFMVDYYSEQERQTFQGMFSSKRPTVLDQARIQAEKARILQGRYYDVSAPGVGVPEYADNIAEAVAFLRVVIIDSPEWWNDGDVLDPSLLFKVYSEAAELDPFRRSSGTEKQDNDGQASGDSNKKHIDSNADDVLASLVDEEIQTPSHQQRVVR